MEKKYVFNVDEISECVAKALANVYYEKQKNDADFRIPADALKVAIEAANLGGRMMLDKVRAEKPTIDKYGIINEVKDYLVISPNGEMKPLTMKTCKWYEFS